MLAAKALGLLCWASVDAVMARQLRTKATASYSFLVSREFLGIVELCNTQSGTCKTVAGGTSASQLKYPQGVAWIDGTEFLVADTGYNRVQRCLADGTFNCTIVAGDGTKGDHADQLRSPGEVAVLSPSQFLVADSYNHRVQLCSFGSKKCETVAGGHGPGDAANQLYFPHGLEVLDHQSFLVADFFNHRVQKCYVRGGDCTTIIPDLDGPYTVSMQSDGDILVSEFYAKDMKSCKVNDGAEAACSQVNGTLEDVVRGHDLLPNGDILLSNEMSGNVELCPGPLSSGGCSTILDYTSFLHGKPSAVRGIAIKL